MSDEDQEDKLDKTSVMPSETFKVRLAQAGQAPPSLVMLVGPSNSIGRQWPIEDTDRIIGRSINAHVYVDERSLSKSHCKLVLKAGEVSIIDLESTNRTVVNGQPIQPLTPLVLKNNDQIKMGNVIFKFLEKGNIETVSVAETFDRGLLDALTGINNKGALMSKAPDLLKRANLLGIPFSVLTFDIDHFKKVNDTYGHAAGDYVLKELVSVIKNGLIRENDFFARSGGEEFCLLILGNQVDKVAEIAERIRNTVEKHEFIFEDVKIPVTISIGVSNSNKDEDNWELAFERADKALYSSKTGGRNRVTAGWAYSPYAKYKNLL